MCVTFFLQMLDAVCNELENYDQLRFVSDIEAHHGDFTRLGRLETRLMVSTSSFSTCLTNIYKCTGT